MKHKLYILFRIIFASTSLLFTSCDVNPNHSLIGRGYCGGDRQLYPSTYWELNDGVLIISGKGQVWCHWERYKDYISSVIINDGVTEIGADAFKEHDLTSVTIPNSVTSIGDGAFGYCDNLTSITIPNSVTSIGNYAFKNCSSLTSIICEAVDPPRLEDSVFEGVKKSISLYVPTESVSAYKSADGWRGFTNIIGM